MFPFGDCLRSLTFLLNLAKGTPLCTPMLRKKLVFLNIKNNSRKHLRELFLYKQTHCIIVRKHIIFFHPDFTVGFGFTPNLPFGSWAYCIDSTLRTTMHITTGREFNPALKIPPYSIVSEYYFSTILLPVQGENDIFDFLDLFFNFCNTDFAISIIATPLLWF